MNLGTDLARLDSLFAIWKRAGFWEYAHPWMECVLPWQTTALYISLVLQNMPTQAIAGGHILLWPSRGNASEVPLFMRPGGDFVVGFGILPAVPRRFLDEALPRLNMASQAAVLMGAKRYLSGLIIFRRRTMESPLRRPVGQSDRTQEEIRSPRAAEPGVCEVRVKADGVAMYRLGGVRSGLFGAALFVDTLQKSVLDFGLFVTQRTALAKADLI